MSMGEIIGLIVIILTVPIWLPLLGVIFMVIVQGLGWAFEYLLIGWYRLTRGRT